LGLLRGQVPDLRRSAAVAPRPVGFFEPLYLYRYAHTTVGDGYHRRRLKGKIAQGLSLSTTIEVADDA
jgi:hypothetical protein